MEVKKETIKSRYKNITHFRQKRLCSVILLVNVTDVTANGVQAKSKPQVWLQF